MKCFLWFKVQRGEGSSSSVCVITSGPHWVTWPDDKGEGRGGDGVRTHLPHPSVQQKGYVPAKSHHKPGHGHASPNRPDPEVSHRLWSCCQKPPPPLQTPPYTPAPPLSSGLPMSQPIIFTVQKRKRECFNACAAHFAARACLQIMWASSGSALLLPEISLKFKWHDGRLSSVHQQASLLVKKKRHCSF